MRILPEAEYDVSPEVQRAVNLNKVSAEVSRLAGSLWIAVAAGLLGAGR
jgi:hypothetical protein